jgi:hypothetical protein
MLQARTASNKVQPMASSTERMQSPTAGIKSGVHRKTVDKTLQTYEKSKTCYVCFLLLVSDFMDIDKVNILRQTDPHI